MFFSEGYGELLTLTAAKLALFQPDFLYILPFINVLIISSTCFPQGNGELPKLTAANLAMHTAALQGFLLLLTIANPSEVTERAPALLSDLISVLESQELSMRTEAGMGVSLLYELASNDRVFTHKRTMAVLDVLNSESLFSLLFTSLFC